MDGERVDDLQYNGLRLIQNPNFFCFGSDSVALANFVSGRPFDRAVDLGTGTGVLAVLTAAKRGFSVTAVEIQPELADMARRSVALNGMQEKIDVVCMPMQDVPARYGRFDVVMSNPPYRKAESGYTQANESVRRARFEIDVTLDEVIDCAARSVKAGGSFYTVYPVSRLAEVLTACSNRNLIPKTLRFPNKKVFMVHCVEGAKHGLLIDTNV